MAETNIEDQRAELERIYSNSPVPMGLIYKVLGLGILGSFLAVLTVRYYAPDKVPHLAWGYENCLQRGSRHD